MRMINVVVFTALQYPRHAHSNPQWLGGDQRWRWTHLRHHFNSSIWCWGRNNHGQLGNGTTNNASSPVPVTGMPLNQTTALAAGSADTCAIKNHIVSCWDSNSHGQLAKEY